MTTVVQVPPWKRFPSGEARPVAILPMQPDEIEKTYGVTFENGSDDLDGYKLAAIGEESAGQLWLLRYDHSPELGTEVLVDSRMPRLAALSAMHRALGGLAPSSVAGEVEWQYGPARPLVLILHGPSGVGKESVIEGLQKATGIHRATSTTDRPPREAEADGIDYHFVTTQEFERRRAARRFAESARVYGDWKGLERTEIEGPIERGRDVIIRTDVQGARTWRRLLEGAVNVLIVATEHTLPREQHRALSRTRIVGRDPGIAADELAARLKEVNEELSAAEENDYIVVNRDNELDDAVADLLAIIDAERLNPLRPTPRLRDGPGTSV